MSNSAHSNPTPTNTDDLMKTTSSDFDEPFSFSINPQTLTQTLDNVSALVDECKMHITEKGLAIVAVDPANVGMVDLFLESDAFEEYEPNNGVVGVDLSRLEDVVSMADGENPITIEYLMDSHKILINVDELEYTLAPIDPDSIREEPDIPDLDNDNQVVIEPSEVSRGITAADMVSDHVTLRVNAEDFTLHIEAEGDTDDVDLEIQEEDLISIKTGKDSTAIFSLDYLIDLLKPIPNSEPMILDIDDEMPLVMSYTYEDDKGEVSFILAPRIQSE